MNKTRRTILVVDDDRIFCQVAVDFLKKFKAEVYSANTLKDGMELCSKRKMDIVLLDQNLPDGEGQALCPHILKCNDQAKIIFNTAFPSYKNAVAAIKAGAHDYISKPFEMEELHMAVEQTLRTLDLENEEHINRYRSGKESEGVVLVGEEGGLSEIKGLIDLASSTNANVLITGETGTGKNVVAKSVHYKSASKERPFIGINCAAIPESLIEAELFGYEKGAFTGAVSAKKGIFEMAEGGTLLLDEIGEMPLHLQSKLLSVLEDKKIMRLGGESVRPIEVRIIATTNVDLEDAVREKSFRKDLFYRLSVIRMHMPPLRQRRGDIAGLCGYFINKIAMGRPVTLPDEETRRLMDYDWPGNVRELQNVIERSLMLQKGSVLTPSELLARSGAAPGPGTAVSPFAVIPDGDVHPTLEEMEAKYIRHSLEKFSGNYTKTANALGISRSTLKRKLNE